MRFILRHIPHISHMYSPAEADLVYSAPVCRAPNSSSRSDGAITAIGITRMFFRPGTTLAHTSWTVDNSFT